MKMLFIFLFLVLNAAIANAQGLAVSPSELNFDMLEKEITIFNLNNETTKYAIYAKNNPQFFEISPEKVIIENNKSEKITIKANKLKGLNDIIYIKENSSKDLIPAVGVRVSVKKELYDGKEICIGSLILLAGVLVYKRFKY